jgi:hypothetical protein
VRVNVNHGGAEFVIRDAVKVHLDRIAMRFARLTRLFSYVVTYSGLVAESFDVVGDLRCGVWRDPDTGRLSFAMEFDTKDDAPTVAAKEICFRRKLVGTMPAMYRRRFVLLYHLV